MEETKITVELDVGPHVRTFVVDFNTLNEVLRIKERKRTGMVTRYVPSSHDMEKPLPLRIVAAARTRMAEHAAST